MTSVPNNKADIVLCCKLHCLGHMVRRRDIDSVADEVAQCAWFRYGVIWIACSVREEWGHD